MKERTAADLAPKSFAPRNPDGNDTPHKFPHLADHLILPRRIATRGLIT